MPIGTASILFWVVQTPGHYPENLSGLVRTKNHQDERRWVLLAGDCMHCYDLLHYPEAPFDTGMPTASDTIYEDVDDVREVRRKMASLKQAYGDELELFVWPAHVEASEEM
ncbi:hypothetical protein CDD83_3047 [Cordyceps sp. RAO-2017]|nr:hypothetical protein CDD83_3047 [Cordyceps sp. RAO-2017]